MGVRERRLAGGARRLALAVVGTMMIVLAAARLAAATPNPAPGQPAPGFSGTDAGGRSVSLADYRGSIIVLEWTNHDCPFVRRHYDTGNMQTLP